MASSLPLLLLGLSIAGAPQARMPFPGKTTGMSRWSATGLKLSVWLGLRAGSLMLAVNRRQEARAKVMECLESI